MREQIVLGTAEYYEDLRNMSGDPTAGMDASGNEPEVVEANRAPEEVIEQEQA